MALTYNKQVRTLDIRGVITLSTGDQINITADDILAYDINESSGSDGLPLGTAEAASYALTISNVGKEYTPAQFDNAEIHMQMGIEDAGKITYSDFGVWYVSEATAPEQSVSIDLNGYDALATLFEVDYGDSEGAYPTTLGSLATTICAASGISLKTSAFRNADIQVSALPDWGDGITLRKIIGYIAACAGGFARIDRSGLLEIVSYADGNTYTLDSDLYTQFTLTNGATFTFNALEVMTVSDESGESDEDTAEDYTRYALDPAIEGNPTNTIRVDYNPLFDAGVANSVVELLDGVSASSASVTWGGDPTVMVGDQLTVTTTDGKVTTILIGSQSVSFSGGLNFSSECSLPSTNAVNSGSYTSSGNVMDGNGNIKANRITNLDKSVVSATIGHFENLTATTVKTDTLLAKIIEAVNLKAQTISAESVTTDVLTATLANIIEATIKKLNAGTIQTDELYAAFAELVTLKVGSITADNIATDKLAAELARITVLVAGTASFDQATIKHLVAEAMNLEFGTAGQVFIKNLAVEYAQMVGAAIGNLCIKASDGNYYRMDVDANGNVTATLTTVTEGEISAGQTGDGQIILETNITASNLSTGNLLATYALINRIDAARISVDELFAREAFISLLRTSKIVDDKSIEMIVGDVEQNAEDIIASRSFSGDTPPTGDLPEGKIWVDTSENPSVIRRWLGLDVTTDAEYSGSGNGKAVETPNGTTAFDQIQQNLTANQNGSGDPTPDNIRWINPGRAKAILTRAGENLIGFDDGTKVSNGVSCVFSDHKISASGACTESWVDLTDHAKVGIQKNKAYTVTFDKAIGYTAVLRLAASSTAELNGYQDVYIYAGDTHASFTADADYSYARIYIGTTTGAEISISDLNVSLTAGSEARNIAYSGESFTLDFGQTVASGTLEWTTGKLVIDKKMLQLDGVTSKVILSSTISKGNIFRVDIPGIKHAESASTVGEVACSHYIATTGNKLYSGTQGVSVSAASDFIQIFDTVRSGMTADEYNSYLAAQYAAGTPVQILYALAEPEEVQLSVLDIRPISGEVNTLSVADGTLTVNYTASGWETVSSLEELNNGLNEALRIANAAVSQEEFQRIVRTDAEGLHVGDNLTDYEVLIDSASVNVVASGKKVSSFSTNFIRLDNMQIRKVRGGLAISVYNG